MSRQATKTLLVLLRNHDPESPPRLKGLTLKPLAGKLEGDQILRGRKRYLDAGRASSYGRTLRRLVAEGLVWRERRTRGEYVYSLTGEGVVKATEIRMEIRDYIAMWAPLVESSE